MRSDKWLENELRGIWQKYFPDLEKKNEVVIRFGRRARTRLGSIKQAQSLKTRAQSFSNNPTIITINGLFKDEKIPNFVLTATIAHELSHYAHGFSSPHNKSYDHPHYGGVVRKEMINRGLEDEYVLSKRWLKENWKDYLLKNCPSFSKKRRRRRKVIYVFR